MIANREYCHYLECFIQEGVTDKAHEWTIFNDALSDCVVHHPFFLGGTIIEYII